MSEQVTVTIRSIAEDGLPDRRDESLTGRLAFLWDGYIVTGWPLYASEDRQSAYTGTWEAADDKLSSVRAFANVTHWVEFPEPIWEYQRRG